MEQDLDALLAWKSELDRVVTAIGQQDVHRQLTDFGELDRLRRKLDRENEAAQFGVLIFRDFVGGTKWVQNAAEPTALLLGGRAVDHGEQNQRDKKCRKSHSPQTGKRCKNCPTLYQ